MIRARFRVALALFALSAAAAAAEPPADLVLLGGAVYTIDAARSWARAVAVRDGRIVYVGDDAGARALAGPVTAAVDLRGQMLVPGFVDAHVHPISGGPGAPVPGPSSRASRRSRRSGSARLAARRAWIVGGGWALPLAPPRIPIGAHSTRPFLIDLRRSPRRRAIASVNSKGRSQHARRPTAGWPDRARREDRRAERLRESASQLIWDVPPPTRRERARRRAGLSRSPPIASASRCGSMRLPARRSLRTSRCRPRRRLACRARGAGRPGAARIRCPHSPRCARRDWGHRRRGRGEAVRRRRGSSGHRALLAPYIGRRQPR
jgi:hypothetical protein